VDDGKRLAEGLIKQLTGGDTITARFLYQEQFEFMLQAKLWLAANHKPALSEDDAIWRRILVVPFDHTIQDPDPKIKAELLDWNRSGQAILAWAVEGCLEWQKFGLGLPKRVAEATTSYRAEQSPIADWMNDCVVLHEGKSEKSESLYKSYSAWAERNGLGRDRLTAKAFGQRLRAEGLKNTRGSGNRTIWFGMGL